MKRMKKKVVAMVTLAMFMMTLLPMAAFAGTENKLTVNKTEVTAKSEVELTIGLDSASATAVDVWAEDANGKIETNVTYDGDGDGPVDGIYHIDSVDDNAKVNVTFNAAGKYTIHAGRYVVQPGGSTEFIEFAAPTKVITVKGPECTNLTGSATVELANKNGVEKTTLEINVEPADGSLNDSYVTIVNDYESRGLKIVDKDGKVTDKAVVADNKVTFYVTAQDYAPAGTYNFDVACNDYKGTVAVEVKGEADVTDDNAATIEALPVEKVITKTQLDQVKFEFKNAAGEVIVPSVAKEPVVENYSGTLVGNYVKVLVKPEDSNVVASELSLVKDSDSKLIVLKSTDVDNFVPGDYEIEFTLANGKSSAVAKFTVGEFEKDNITGMEIRPIDKDGDIVLEKGAGQYEGKYTGTTKFEVVLVDKNGITQAATDYTLAINTVTADAKDVKIGLNKDAVNTIRATYSGEKLADVLGTKVTALAVSKDGKYTAEYDFTLAEEAAAATDYKLSFGEVKDGVVLKNNIVKYDVKNSDDKALDTVTKAYVEVVEQSNKDAKVSASITENPREIKVYSDKDTTVDLRVVVIGKNAGDKADVMYSGTLTYKIGEVAPEAANTTVVMTLGSTNMIVNNEVVDMKDAAPFAQDNRTFVPFRALGEKVLGATVEYDKDTKTVTYELDGNKIVMTLDSKTYTVNGAEKTMDVAPFAKDNRTYVPVRFVGEALGFTVTGLTNGAGQYVGVAFTK